MSSLFHRHLYEISQFPIVLDYTCLTQLLERRYNHYNIFWIRIRAYVSLSLIRKRWPYLGLSWMYLSSPLILNCSELHLSRNVIGVPITPLQYLSDKDATVNCFPLNRDMMCNSSCSPFSVLRSPFSVLHRVAFLWNAVKCFFTIVVAF